MFLCGAQGASPWSGIRCSGTSRARAESVSGHVLTGHKSANNPQKGLNVQTIIRWILSRDETDEAQTNISQQSAPQLKEAGIN